MHKYAIINTELHTPAEIPVQNQYAGRSMNSKALETATAVARFLLAQSHRVGNSSLKGQSLMGILSVMVAAEKRDHEALNPIFHEILLFGSTARGEETPGDIDMIAFDTGFYSNILRETQYGKGSLRGTISRLIEGWFPHDAQADFGEKLPSESLPVDLLVLPLKGLTDRKERRIIVSKQSDPQFFQNAFSCIWRFEIDQGPYLGTFVKTDISYFEEKYGVNLSELRKPCEQTG
jgi:hypothetical protein